MSACALGVFDAALFFLRVYLIDDSTVKWSRSFVPVVLCEKFYVFFDGCFSPNPVNDGSPNICQLWRCASVRICIYQDFAKESGYMSELCKASSTR